MAVLTPSDIADLVITTQRKLGRLRFQNIAQNIQHCEVFSKWFKRDRLTFDSGYGISRTLMNRVDSAAAKHVGPMQEDKVNIINVLDQLTVDWVHAQTSWAIIYQTDILMNSHSALVVNILRPRRAAALIGLAEELESKAWSSPASPSEKTLPYGLPYWIVQNASTGFNGGVASGHTTVGGVSLSDSPTFKNYSGTYAAATKGDLIKKLRTMHRKCRFKSPIKIEDFRGAQGDRYRLYVDEATISAAEDIGEAQNENLGRDIASMDGTTVFRKHPIVWVPELDSTTNNPIYMVDHSTFYPVVLRGDYLREGSPRESSDQHNVYEVFVDLTYNYICVDRRRNGVVYKA